MFHIGVVDNLLYYTMELADDAAGNKSVRDVFPADYRPLTLAAALRHRLSVDLAMELTRRLLRGLVALHELDMVHHDIKPSNIVIVNRQPKLADIGLISTSDEQGQPLGTPRYMPPDQVMNKTSDTYALGKVLHEMIAGRQPASFPALPLDQDLRSANWNLAKIDALLVRACAARGEDRYPSAVEMLEDLEGCAGLSFDSFFDDMPEVEPPPAPSASRVAVRITMQLIHALPWILGFILAWRALSYLMTLMPEG